MEAAAFAAALSRALDARRLCESGRPATIEVWSGRPGPGEAVALYLSEGAMRAAAEAFGPAPGASSHAALPAGCAPLIDSQTPPWGLQEALGRLSGP